MKLHGLNGRLIKGLNMTDSVGGPDYSQMAIYAKCGFQLIPLHKWDSKSSHKGKERPDGKRPLHSDWVKKAYGAKVVAMAEAGGNNTGVRLTPEQLVIDVDPRNFPEGRDSFAELCRDVGLDADAYPRVETGSGGLHVYMNKPADVSTLDSLEAYQGVEFKTYGRQVVAAGSRHPNGKLYEWDLFAPELDSMFMPNGKVGSARIPDRLLTLIRRPAKSGSSSADGGEYDQERIGKMLDGLDPTEFKDQDLWLTLMMSVHHASGGSARDEFIEWSTRDPQYADDGWIIGRRWDSLHRKTDGPARTYRTLNKFLKDAGKEDLIPTVSAAQDFADDIELPGEEGQIVLEDMEHEELGPLSRMNKRYWAVTDGGKFRIMEQIEDPALKRKMWIQYGKQDFMDMLSNRRVEKMVVNKKGEQELKIVPISNAWLEWGPRRSAMGVVFDPEKDHPGWLNLWTGWAVEPKAGDWSLTQELIRDVLCNGNEEANDYVIKWIAYMVQKPWEPPGVAICFHGDKGTGKSTLGHALVELAGRHGLQTSSPKHLTGNFNSHLMDCVMLFADEAVSPGDKEAKNILKALITERDMAYEAKGKDVKRGVNRVHVMMASNDDRFLDTGTADGERRYFVSKVNNTRQGDEVFFGALRRQLFEQGGLAAMLHDLQLMDLKGWTPRTSIPNTEALVEQKLRNMDPVQEWWYEQLENQRLNVEPTRDGMRWEDGPIKVYYQEVQEDFRNWCAQNSIRANAMNRGIERYFAAELKRICPDLNPDAREVLPTDDGLRASEIKAIGTGNRARAYAIPSLQECREAFERVVKGAVFSPIE